jgi:hypothetical protein
MSYSYSKSGTIKECREGFAHYKEGLNLPAQEKSIYDGVRGVLDKMDGMFAPEYNNVTLNVSGSQVSGSDGKSLGQTLNVSVTHMYVPPPNPPTE